MTQSPGPVISTPEAATEGMVAPGQEEMLDQFIQEQEAAQAEPEKILGKFSSQEELARAYAELEKKLGQQSQEPAQETVSQPQGYTAEQAVEIYGQEAVDALQAKGVNLADVMYQADNGQDISQHYDTLAEAFNVPRQVVENYVAKAQAPAQEAGGGLSEQDAAELKAMVGGDDGFTALSQWAASNLNPQELADYNAVVDSGNKDAIRWALRDISNRAAGTKPAEPKLIGGGAPATEQVFESKQQVLDAMNKRNERGQRLYDIDEAYREKVIGILARSEVF